MKELHKNGIEVILDVVFNHTAEGNENGPYISFRGIDNRNYYLLTPDGGYYNFSGCGNTMNCNNPVVRFFIIDCLRYWVTAYHVDGFRFDLASILSRDEFGAPMISPPLLELIAHDAVLGRSVLIAEAWDAGGLYQVGNFPAWNRWAEWNGKYRDCVRKFIKGECADASVNELRKRQMKNFLTVLLTSRGVPMLLSGDEIANTQFGNNNAYCQDNEISYLDWDRNEKYRDIYDYVRRLISFRNAHPDGSLMLGPRSSAVLIAK